MVSKTDKEILKDLNEGIDSFSEDYIEKPIAPKSERYLYGPNEIAGSLINVIKRFGYKYGFINSDIISNWNNIVGEQFSNLITPIKIAFYSKQRVNGTLYVKVKVPSVLAIAQYQFPTIIDRINTYFGYNAVEKIKVKC